MTSVRQRTCAAGAAVAVLAGVLVDHGAMFGSDFTRSALLGLALGAVLGLVPSGTPLLRLAGFASGFAAAWIGYLLRAGALPDIPMGRAIAAVVVVSLITAVATATADRVPLWAGLVGAAALIGGFEETYLASPTDVVADSTVAATTTLLAVAFGFLVTVLVSAVASTRASQDGVADGAVGRHATRDGNDGTYENGFVLGGSSTASNAPLPGPRPTVDAPTTNETTR